MVAITTCIKGKQKLDQVPTVSDGSMSRRVLAGARPTQCFCSVLAGARLMQCFCSGEAKASAKKIVHASKVSIRHAVSHPVFKRKPNA